MGGEASGSYISRALTLAARGRGTTHPNPMVGAVIVKDGKVVGEGWHRRAGEPHAEVLAIEMAGELARGATLYVNLEPCSHHGRTGPCTEAIISAGIVKVVSSTEDPHHLVAGKGFRRLREKGVEAVVGEGRERALELNRAFFHYALRGTPFVTLKLASTLDGRIAAPDGSSKWITGDKARAAVHRMRRESDAVLVGIGTVLADNPRLTVRSTGPVKGTEKVKRGRPQPLRIVLDPTLRTPTVSWLIQQAQDGKTVIFSRDDLPSGKYHEFEQHGVEVMKVPAYGGRFRWDDLAVKLVEQDVLHLMVEGGSETAAWFIREGAVNRLELFLGPTVLGSDGIPSVGSLGITTLSQAPGWSIRSCRKTGNDLRITADIVQR